MLIRWKEFTLHMAVWLCENKLSQVIYIQARSQTSRADFAYIPSSVDGWELAHTIRTEAFNGKTDPGRSKKWSVWYLRCVDKYAS